MKINCGAGKRHHKGYTTIDIEPKNNPDIVGDFRKMNFVDIEEIRAEHILEHFSREEGYEVLSQWYRWLKSGRMIVIETPDFEGICDNFRKDKYWMTRHAYGSQEAEWAFHRDGWYEEKFKEILPKIGFKIIEIRKSVSRKILPNITVVAVKDGI